MLFEFSLQLDQRSRGRIDGDLDSAVFTRGGEEPKCLDPADPEMLRHLLLCSALDIIEVSRLQLEFVLVRSERGTLQLRVGTRHASLPSADSLAHLSLGRNCRPSGCSRPILISP